VSPLQLFADLLVTRMLDFNEPSGIGTRKSAARGVPTRDARSAVAGRETYILDVLGIAWRSGKPHIQCPYSSHPDHHPSWRWDRDKALAFCTCIDKAHSIFDVILAKEGGDFEGAKLRAMEILGHDDLIRDPGALKGLTLEEYSEAKRLPIEWLQEIGLRNGSYGKTPAVRIPYFNERGQPQTVQFRVSLTGEKKHFFKKGVPVCLYGAHQAAHLKDAGYVVIVEGASDTQTLWCHGFPSMGLPGAQNWDEERDAHLINDVPIIYIVVEPDLGGQRTIRWLSRSSIAPRSRLIHMSGATKDPSALYLSDPGGFPAAFQALIDAAKPLPVETITRIPRSAIDLPIIFLRAGKMHRVADEGLAALRDMGVEFYQRDRTLVRVAGFKAKASDGAAIITPGIIPIALPLLRRALGQSAQWQKITAKGEAIPCDPPKDVVEQIASMIGEWPFPPLAGVINTPTLRPDGSLLTEAGYDEATGLVLFAPPKMPHVSRNPDQRDAEQALDVLDDLLQDFPFIDGPSRAVALSMLMTPVLRGGLPPAVPMHLVTKPAPGTGASYLCDIASAIATGERCAVISLSANPEETEKRLIGAIISGFPIITLDNCSRPLEGDTLCQATERPVLSLRPLGRSPPIVIPNTYTVFANGNQASVVEDVVRRTIISGLDANMEHPEDREFTRNPFAAVLADRGKYVAACLTLARAYIVAGRPNKLKPLASYECWSDTVRSALTWLGQDDPVATMSTARAADGPRQKRAAVFKAWATEYVMDTGVTTSALIGATEEVQKTSRPNDEGGWKRPVLREALLDVAPQQGTPQKIDPKQLGKWLSKNLSTIAGSCKLTVDRSDAARPRWKLVRSIR
jgi:putative DNA primase/helicase